MNQTKVLAVESVSSDKVVGQASTSVVVTEVAPDVQQAVVQDGGVVQVVQGWKTRVRNALGIFVATVVGVMLWCFVEKQNAALQDVVVKPDQAVVKVVR